MSGHKKVVIEIVGHMFSSEECKEMFTFNPYKDYVDTFKGKDDEEMSDIEFLSREWLNTVNNTEIGNEEK